MTFICPFPAGGGTDILTRMLAQELQDKLKQHGHRREPRRAPAPWSRRRRSRARRPTATRSSSRRSTTLAIGPSVYKSLPYDTVKDFAPIGLVGSAQFALVANPSLGANTLPELIALIKSQAGQMSYGTSGASTPHHLFMEMFLKMIGAQGAARALSRQRGRR